MEGKTIYLAVPALKIDIDTEVYLNKGFLKMDNEEKKKLLLLIYRLFHCQKYLRAQGTIRIQQTCWIFQGKRERERDDLICRTRGELLNLKGLKQNDEIEEKGSDTNLHS